MSANIDDWYWVANILVAASARQRTRKSIVDELIEQNPFKVDAKHVECKVDAARRHGLITFSSVQVICPNENRYVSVLAITPKGRKTLQAYAKTGALMEDAMKLLGERIEGATLFVEKAVGS